MITLNPSKENTEVRLETGHSKLRQKKIQWYHIKFTEGVHDYGYIQRAVLLNLTKSH